MCWKRRRPWGRRGPREGGPPWTCLCQRLEDPRQALDGDDGGVDIMHKLEDAAEGECGRVADHRLGIPQQLGEEAEGHVAQGLETTDRRALHDRSKGKGGGLTPTPGCRA